MTEKKQHSQIFNSWLQQHQAVLFKVVRAYAFTPVDQDDLFQEISIQIWKSIPRFRSESSVVTWLYRISINTALKWVRSEKKHRDNHFSLDGEASILTEKPESRDERLDWLFAEIAKLNRIDRSLTLLLLDGFSYREMADVLGISESNIGVKIHRIKNHLIRQSENGTSHGI
ncbi:MAG: RNA polymerase sigma factor [Balneolaceae bacterium]